MKNIFKSLLLVFLLCLLVSCKSQEINNLEIESKIENAKLEIIEQEYNKNIDQVNLFNMEFKKRLFGEKQNINLDGFMTVDKNIEETLSNLFNILGVDSYEKIFNIDMYPFLEEETGYIIDYISIQTIDNSVVFEFKWSNGKIVSYNYD